MQREADFYITNCLCRILMADCAPSEFRRRNIAIVKVIRIAYEQDMPAAHEYMRMLLAEAEAGGFARAPDAGMESKVIRP